MIKTQSEKFFCLTTFLSTGNKFSTGCCSTKICLEIQNIVKEYMLESMELTLDGSRLVESFCFLH